MNKVRERKLEARARRQESLHGVTTEKTIIQVPQPKNMVKKESEIIKVKSKSPEVTEVVRRGPGRPPKMASEKINKKMVTGKAKKLAGTKGKK